MHILISNPTKTKVKLSQWNVIVEHFTSVIGTQKQYANRIEPTNVTDWWIFLFAIKFTACSL